MAGGTTNANNIAVSSLSNSNNHYENSLHTYNEIFYDSNVDSKERERRTSKHNTE